MNELYLGSTLDPWVLDLFSKSSTTSNIAEDQSQYDRFAFLTIFLFPPGIETFLFILEFRTFGRIYLKKKNLSSSVF